MVMDPKKYQQRMKERAAKAPETRQTEALEEIADAMIDIKSEIISLNHNISAYLRSPAKI